MSPQRSWTSVLLLADGRFPAGGHAHSGGREAAVTAGTVRDMGSLELFLRGRLRTAGLVAAGLAAAACERARSQGAAGCGPEGAAGRPGSWAALDAEADARTPSPAQREASRRQGRALLRAARVAWPEAKCLAEIANVAQPPSRDAANAPLWDAAKAPHQPIVLGAAMAAAGGCPEDAAAVAAYQSVTGPASAAVRLLSLDPIEVSGLLARLADDIDDVAERAIRASRDGSVIFPTASTHAAVSFSKSSSRASILGLQ